MITVFHYISGEVIRLGDRIRNAGRLGYVSEIFEPGSDNSLAHDFPNGGVLTITNWDGKNSAEVWEPPDGQFWEDLEFMGRENDRG